ncbi:MAG: hypothetical protein ACI9TY_001447 [Alphaproteobacteria bacterium]|jgi:hypothetical protein
MFLAISSLCFTIFAIGHYFSSGSNSGLILFAFLYSAILFGRFIAKEHGKPVKLFTTKEHAGTKATLYLFSTILAFSFEMGIVDLSLSFNLTGRLEFTLIALALYVIPLSLGYVMSKQAMLVMTMPNGDEI